MSCPDDCGPCGGVCGDGLCDFAVEDCASCPSDCGTCPPMGCGDGVCAPGEDCMICPSDCGACPPMPCGDGVCAPFESCMICPMDCGACPPMGCGNGICDFDTFESCFSCSADCGMCGVASCFETVTCTLGCGGGSPGCLGNCLARACPSARTMLLGQLSCIAGSGCGTDLACLIGACPELLMCLTHRC